MAHVVADHFLSNAFTADHNLTTATVKIALYKSTCTPSASAQYMDDASLASATYECDGTGYARGFAGSGRKTLASATVTVDHTNHRAVFDAADPTAWSGFDAGTVGWWVVYRHRTSDADSEFLFAVDVSDFTPAGGSYTVEFYSGGIAWNRQG